MKRLFTRFSYKIHRVDLQSLYAVNLYRCSSSYSYILKATIDIFNLLHK